MLRVHESSQFAHTVFLDVYLKEAFNSSYEVLEVGSQDINGSILKDKRTDIKWSSVDIEQSPGVTHVLRNPYQYPFADETFDAVVSTSVFEHMEFFWLSFLEMARVCKANGYIYINAPSNGPIHRFPIDAWRFYPDAGSQLAKWGVRNGFNTYLIEALMLKLSEREVWADSIYVFGNNGPLTSGSTETLKSKLGDLVYFDGFQSSIGNSSIPHPDNLKIKTLHRQLKKIRKVLETKLKP